MTTVVMICLVLSFLSLFISDHSGTGISTLLITFLTTVCLPFSLIQVLIPVRRIGFNGHVTVYWSVSGSGFSADHVTNTDIQPMAGSLTMVTGKS